MIIQITLTQPQILLLADVINEYAQRTAPDHADYYVPKPEEIINDAIVTGLKIIHQDLKTWNYDPTDEIG
jgi:hypothetical protein